MRRVYPAEAHRFGAMRSSFGDASGMLIAQHQFPVQFDQERDKLEELDHDLILNRDREHAIRCLTEYTGTGDLGIGEWIRRSPPESVLAFLQDILKADQTVTWTGFRVLGTVHRTTRQALWTLEIFAKHPESKTPVFNTANAPCLIQGSRHGRILR